MLIWKTKKDAAFNILLLNVGPAMYVNCSFVIYKIILDRQGHRDKGVHAPLIGMTPLVHSAHDNLKFQAVAAISFTTRFEGSKLANKPLSRPL